MEHVSLELCGPSDKSVKEGDIECFRSSGMSFWLFGKCVQKLSELK